MNTQSRLTCFAAPAVAILAVAAHAQQYTATLFGPPEQTEIYLFGAGSSRQTGLLITETGGHAVFWFAGTGNPVDLHPAAAESSTAYGCGGLQQVGVADFDGQTHAMLWTGTAASAIDLTPPDFGYASASRTDGLTQVGAGRGPGTGRGPHALAWTGTAASVVDLHPNDYTNSTASDVDGTTIVGDAIDTFGMRNAGFWTSLDAQSWVSLHPPAGFDESTATAVEGGQIGGTGQGPATGGETHGLLWTDGGAAMIDLSPIGYLGSYINAVGGGVQAGSVIMAFDGVTEHAAVWRGTAESVVDLHDIIPGGPWVSSRVTGIDADGTLYGYASNGTWNAPVKWTAAPTVCGPADVGGAGGSAGPDGELNNNDFVVYIDLFFGHAHTPDVGTTGGVPGTDGVFDNNDFVVFIDRFFTGC